MAVSASPIRDTYDTAPIRGRYARISGPYRNYCKVRVPYRKIRIPDRGRIAIFKTLKILILKFKKQIAFFREKKKTSASSCVLLCWPRTINSPATIISPATGQATILPSVTISSPEVGFFVGFLIYVFVM